MSDERYNLRWKGKTLGPFTRREIERQIQDQDIGTLHEIWSDGNWITLKEFLSPKKVPPSSHPFSEAAREKTLPEGPSIPKPTPPPVWLMSGYLIIFVLLSLAMLGWTQTWTAPEGWAPLLGLGLGLVGGLFGLLTFFQEEKKHGGIIVGLSIVLAFANMMFT